MRNEQEVDEVCVQAEKAQPDVTLLTRNVSYLLGRAKLRLSTLANKKLLSELGITNVQASLLFLISIGEANSMKALAQSSGMDMATTSRLIATLVARGLIVRLRSDSDRRVTGLQLTTDGWVLARRFPQILDDVVDSALHAFDDERKHALRDMLEDLIRSLRDVENRPMPGAATKSIRASERRCWTECEDLLMFPSREA